MKRFYPRTVVLYVPTGKMYVSHFPIQIQMTALCAESLTLFFGLKRTSECQVVYIKVVSMTRTTFRSILGDLLASIFNTNINDGLSPTGQ